MQNPLDTLGEIAKSDDRRAVSPVIGVILMVAITVILAAVIATFVLGLGEQVSDTTPNANFQADFASDNASVGNNDTFVTIQHQSGDEIDLNELRIGGDVDISSDELISELSAETFAAGDSVDLIINDSGSPSFGVGSSIDEGEEIDIIFQSEGGAGSVLRTFEVPRNYSTP